MCDGILSEKLKIIGELMSMEGARGSQEYLERHVAWTLDELKAYRDKLSMPANDTV